MAITGVLAPGAGAILLTLEPADLERAIRTARGSESERARFHRPYVVLMNDPAIEQIEVVTELRRVELAAEERFRRGDFMFSARQANEIVRPMHGKVTIAVRVRFHPQNVLMRVPQYEIVIGNGFVKALDVRLMPLYAQAAPNQRPGTSTPLVGGLVEADFDAATIGQTTREVTVTLEGKELARATIDFGKLM